MDRISTQLSVVVLLVIAWFAAHHLQFVFLDAATLKAYGPIFEGMDSILCFGVAPYLAARTLLELFALFVPYLRNLRMAGASGRHQLHRLALWLTVPVSLMHAYGHSLFWLQASAQDPELLRLYSLPALLLLTTLTVLVVTYLLLMGFAWNHRRGLGHGISLFMLVFAVVTTVQDLGRTVTGEPLVNQKALIHAGLFLVLALTLMVAVQTRGPVRTAAGKSLPLRWTPAGLLPAVWAGVITAMVDRIWGYQLPPYVTWILLAGFYLVATRLFNPKARLAGYTHGVDAGAIGSAQTRASLVGAAYLGAIAVGLPWLAGLLHLPHTQPLELLLLAAVGLDFYQEIRIRCSHDLQPVFVFHDVACAEAARQCLAAEALPCVFRGFHHRGLLYFLGPYLDITLLVRETDRAKVTALLEAQFGDTDNAWLHPATP